MCHLLTPWIHSEPTQGRLRDMTYSLIFDGREVHSDLFSRKMTKGICYVTTESRSQQFDYYSGIGYNCTRVVPSCYIVVEHRHLYEPEYLHKSVILQSATQLRLPTSIASIHYNLLSDCVQQLQ